MGKILVMGASGFIGLHLVEALIQKGHMVVGYDRIGSPPPIKDKNYTHLQGNYSTEQNYEKILVDNNVSVIFHLISTTFPAEGVMNAEQEIYSDVIPTIRLLQAAVNAGVKKVIFPSSGGTVYGEGRDLNSESDSLHPQCIYAANKAAIEGYLQTFAAMSEMECRIARIANIYGYCTQNGRSQGIIPIFAKQLLANKPIALYGDTVRDYLYMSDLIRALIRIMNYQGDTQIFNIGTGIGTSLSDVVRIFEEQTNRKFAGVQHFERRKCDVQSNILNVTAAETELGWKAEIDIKTGISLVCKNYGIECFI